MNRIAALLKRIRPSQILMAFMAGMFLLVSTACSSDKVQAQTPDGSRQQVPAGLEAVPGKRNPRPEVPERAVTNTFEGSSMNEFSDTDPRTQDTASDKAKALVENAKRNVIDQTGDLGENTKRTLDKKGENLEDFGKNVQRSAEDTKDTAQRKAEDFAEGTKQGAGNVKDNTLDAATGLKKGADRTAEDVKQNIKANTPDAEDLTRGTKQAARNAAENTRAAGRDAAEKTQRATQDTSEAVQDRANRAGKSTTNFIQDKVNQFVRGTEEATKKANNAIDNTVD